MSAEVSAEGMHRVRPRLDGRFLAKILKEAGEEVAPGTAIAVMCDFEVRCEWCELWGVMTGSRYERCSTRLLS